MAVDEGMQVSVPEVNISSLLCVLGKPTGEPFLVCRQKNGGLGKSSEVSG